MKPFKGVKWHAVQTKFTIKRFKQDVKEELNTCASEQNYGYDLWKALWVSLALSLSTLPYLKVTSNQLFRLQKERYEIDMKNIYMKNIVLCAIVQTRAKYCVLRKTLIWKYILQY